MPRIKLKEREKYSFSHIQKICISHINPAGHVGTSQMADLIHDGRFQLLKYMGCNELNLGDNETGVIIGDLVINYKMELFIDDEVLIETDIDEIEEKGFRIFYRISRDGRTATVAETGHVTFSYAKKSICPVPGIFKEKLEKLKSA